MIRSENIHGYIFFFRNSMYREPTITQYFKGKINRSKCSLFLPTVFSQVIYNAITDFYYI